MIDLISFGIVIDDIALPDGTTRLGILGGGGPQTVWGMAAALGTGESVGLAAEIGGDFDRNALAPLEAARVNLSGVRQSTAVTPRAWQRIAADGTRVHEWQSPPLKSITFGTSLSELLPPNYRAARSFHWGLHPENPALTNAHNLTTAGARVSLETFKPPEHPLAAARLRDLLAACTVFSPNWAEAAGIIGSTDYATVLREFQSAGSRILALRRGSTGAEIWDFTAERGVRVPAVPTSVIDVVGAGNAFCGALLATLDQGIESAACHAVTAASYLVEQYGLPDHLPDPAEYNQRLALARAGIERLNLP